MVLFWFDILTGSKDRDHEKWTFLFCLRRYAVSSKSSCICPYNLCELTIKVLTIIRTNTSWFKTSLITQSEYFEKPEFKYSRLCSIMTLCVCFVCFVVYCFYFCFKECSIVAKDEFGDQILASGCTLKHVSLYYSTSLVFLFKKTKSAAKKNFRIILFSF